MDALSEYDKDYIEQYGIHLYNRNKFCMAIAEQIRHKENKITRENNIIPLPPIVELPTIRKPNTEYITDITDLIQGT